MQIERLETSERFCGPQDQATAVTSAGESPSTSLEPQQSDCARLLPSTPNSVWSSPMKRRGSFKTRSC